MCLQSDDSSEKNFYRLLLQLSRRTRVSEPSRLIVLSMRNRLDTGETMSEVSIVDGSWISSRVSTDSGGRCGGPT